MSLSFEQATAAHRTGQDVCVIAGPGSGKTRVLIERFSWLVLERHISPSRILAITFTEKAATEIKERLVKKFEALPEIREQIERAYVSTIHAFCARVLRENSIAAAIDPAFQVLEASQSDPLLHGVVDEVLEDIYRNQSERMRRFLRSLSVGTQRGSFVPDLAGSLVDIYETLRLAGASVGDFRHPPPPYADMLTRVRTIAAEILNDNLRPRTDKQCEQHDIARAWAARVYALGDSPTEEHFRALNRERKLDTRSLVKDSAAHRHENEIRDLCLRLRGTLIMHYYSGERDLIAEAIENIDSLYRERKRRMSALDFSDLEEGVIGLLQSDPKLRLQVQQSFDYILMDELQDTNPLQWRLISLIRRAGNFFAVGDVNQSIYGFRHAEPALFKDYRASLVETGLHVDELRTNYRSRAAVLDSANRVFARAAGVEAHTLSPGSEFCSKSEPSAEAIVVAADSADVGEEMEARWVARRIVELVGNLRIGDGRPARFGDIAILTRANQTTGELQRALDEFGVPSIVLGGQTFFETREIRDLKLILDVLVNPCNEVSLAGLLRSPIFGVTDDDLLRLCHEFGSLSRAIRNQPPPHWETIDELRRIRNLVSPDRLVRRILDDCDYESGLTERGRGNVEKFLSTLRTRYHRDPRSLADLVKEIERAAPEAEAPPPDFGDAVRLMTIHKAKGLEFPIVFLPYLHKSRSNDFPIISYSRQHGLGAKWREPGTNASISDCIRDENKRAQNAARDEEENRLLYVGMTRAMEHLVLSWTSTPRARGNTWASLVAPALAVSADTAINEAIVQHETGVRVLVVDRTPDPIQTLATASPESADPIIERSMTEELHDSAVSVTDVSRFLECPRKYYLGRYLRWQQELRKITPIDEEYDPSPRDEVDPTEIGTQVHALLAGQPLANPEREALDLAGRFRESELGRMAAKARHAQHEWDFVMSRDDVVVRGQIDLWFEYGKDLVIVDYKTDRVRPPIDAEAVRGYALQVQIYAAALERALGKRATRGLLYFLRPDTTFEVDVSPLAQAAALDVIRDLRAAQQTLDFVTRRGELCARCEYTSGWCPDDRSEHAAVIGAGAEI